MAVYPKTSVTLADVARRAKVSRMAAARVLLGTGGKHIRVGAETAERIRRVAAEIDYRANLVARQLAGKRSGLLGVVIHSFAPPAHYAGLAVMEREAAARGYRLMVGQVHDDPRRFASYVDDFSGRGVEGAICISHQYPGQAEQVARLFKRLPNVVFVGRPAVSDAAYVESDINEGIRQAIDHLLASGRRRIGLGLANLKYATLQRRREAYLRVLGDHGIAVDDRLIWSADQPGDPTPEKIEHLIDELVIGQSVDALLASNDRWAVRFIKAARKRGIRVPEDVAVIGYDNSDVAEAVDPELTTVDPNADEVSKHVIDLLVTLIEDDGSTARDAKERQISVRPRLVVRESA